MHRIRMPRIADKLGAAGGRIGRGDLDVARVGTGEDRPEERAGGGAELIRRLARGAGRHGERRRIRRGLHRGQEEGDMPERIGTKR